MLKIIPYRTIYLVALSFLAISLPLSIFTTSIAEIILILNWILEGDFRSKWRRICQRRSIWLIVSLYLLHLLGLLYTSEFDYALHSLRINLPLLFLPVIIGTSPVLKNMEIKVVLVSFIAAVTASTLVSASILFGIIPIEFHDVGDISVFVSHVRLSLLINMAIFILFYFIFSNEFSFSRKVKVAFFSVMIWLAGFIFLLKSLTGIVGLMAIGVIIFWIVYRKVKHLILKWFLVVMMITVAMLVVSFVARSVNRFYMVENIDLSALAEKTVNGNSYKHDLDNKQTENGHFVWLYVCEDELRSGWNAISDYDYDGRDEAGQRVKYTLIRYMTSRGYRKDSVGLTRLTERDIELIENGKANYIYGNRISLYPKIYEVLWQIEMYRSGRNPSGHSITQRLHFMKAGIEIARKNFWIGVGTGDVAGAFIAYYEESNSQLHKKYWHQAHNQYITYFTTFGLIGFIWFLVALIWPVFLEKKWSSYLFIVFFIIGLISMMNEDTLETHTGNSFFAFFYALFLLGTSINGDREASRETTEGTRPDKKSSHDPSTA